MQIPKGRASVYVYGEHMYRQVKKKGEIRCLKCQIEACDDLARIQCGNLLLA